jgi:hypothetical protein
LAEAKTTATLDCVSDPYGIPTNFFGTPPEEFYGLVGRVIMLASLLEQKVLELTWSLDRTQPQNVHAGKPMPTLMTICQDRLTQLPELAPAGIELLDRSQEALNQRHEVAHSLWPSPDADSAFGWRPMVARRRTSLEDWVATVETNEASLRALIATLVDLVEASNRFRQRVEAEHQRRVITSRA